MADISSFKYTRRQRAVNTSKFSYDEVATPNVSSKSKNLVKTRERPGRTRNPRHDPNAKTRPSKRRTAEPNEEEPPVRTSKDNSKKQRKKKVTKKQQKSRQEKSSRRTKTLNPPMYPAKTISSTMLREKANRSANPNKLHALFNEVMRSEATNLGEVYKGQFRFLFNAVKGVSREFLQTIQQESSASFQKGIAKKSKE